MSIIRNERPPYASLRSIVDGNTLRVVPGVFDALSAKVAELAGFEAVHASGASISASFGYPDVGLLTLTESVQVTSRIVSAVAVPVLADAESGYGGPVSVNRTVAELENAGAQGIHIEDQIDTARSSGLADKSVIPLDRAVRRLAVAIDARKDSQFVVIARTNARHTMDMNEVVRRSQAFLENGADGIFADGLQSAEEVRTLGRQVKGPKVLTRRSGGPTSGIGLEELEDLGFRLALFAVAPILASAYALRRVMEEIRVTNSEGPMVEAMLELPELYRLLNLEQLMRLDARFS